MRHRSTDHFLTPDEAIEAAERAIQENGMREWPQCVILKNPAIIPQPPMLTREPSDEDGDADSHSFIVPYGLKGELSPSGVPITRLCILIDAVTGEFEEVATFGKPITYLQRDAAIGIVASALRIPEDRLQVTDASLMFQSSEITHLRVYPFWRVVVNERVYYVDQEGKLYNDIPPGKSGC
jgi:hypothetical protein